MYLVKIVDRIIGSHPLRKTGLPFSGIIAFSLALVLALSACNLEQEPTLRVGTSVWPGYEPLFLARSLGYYDGSSIKLVELTSLSEISHALRSGTLEAATLTLDEALNLEAQGFNLEVILIMDISNGGDVLLVKPGIHSLADLRNKRIAIEPSTLSAIMLNSALDVAGLTLADITLVDCEIDHQAQCYEDSDAVVASDPVKTKLLASGAKVLFDSSQIPGRIVDVLVVPPEIAQSHPRSLKRLLAGYFKAQMYLASAPEEASELMAPRLGVSPRQVLSSFKGLIIPDLRENQASLRPEPAPLEKTAYNLAEFMFAKGLLAKVPTLNGLAEGRFLPDETP